MRPKKQKEEDDFAVSAPGGFAAMHHFKVISAKQGALLAVALIAIICAVVFPVLHASHTATNEQRKDTVATELTVYAQRMQSLLGRLLVLGRGVEGFLLGSDLRKLNHTANLTTQESDRVQTLPAFDAYIGVAEARNLTQGFISIQLQPSGVIWQAWPSGSAPKGLDLLAREREGGQIDTLIQNDEMIVVGPITLVQGGVAMIGRIPIFLPNQPRTKEFWWGNVGILWSIDDFKAAIEIQALSSRMDWRIQQVESPFQIIDESPGYSSATSDAVSAVITPDLFATAWLLTIRPRLVEFSETEVTTVLVCAVVFSCIVVGVVHAAYILCTKVDDPTGFAPKHGPLYFVQFNIHQFMRLWTILPEDTSAIANQLNEHSAVVAQKHRVYRTMQETDATVLACRNASQAFKVAENLLQDFYDYTSENIEESFRPKLHLHMSISSVTAVKAARQSDRTITYQGADVDRAIEAHIRGGEYEALFMDVLTREGLPLWVKRSITMRPIPRQAGSLVAFDFITVSNVPPPLPLSRKQSMAPGASVGDSAHDLATFEPRKHSATVRVEPQSPAGVAGTLTHSSNSGGRSSNDLQTSDRTDAMSSMNSEAKSILRRESVDPDTDDGGNSLSGVQNSMKMVNVRQNKTVRRLIDRTVASPQERSLLYSIGSFFFEGYRIMFNGFQPAERNNILLRLKMIFGLSNTNMMESLAVRAAMMLMKTEMQRNEAILSPSGEPQPPPRDRENSMESIASSMSSQQQSASARVPNTMVKSTNSSHNTGFQSRQHLNIFMAAGNDDMMVGANI